MNAYRRVQSGYGGGMPTIIRNLLIVNVIFYILQNASGPGFTYFLSLVPQLAWRRFFLFQFVTYMFLHGGFAHIFFNMYALWLFGSDLARMWGNREFTKYYFICGVGAGLIYSLFNFNSLNPMLGASGAIYGLLVAYAVMFPTRRLMLLFPPMVISARTLALFYIGIDLVFSIIPRASHGFQVAHVAHLGGALVGFIYMKRVISIPLSEWKTRFDQWNQRRKQKARWEKQKEQERMRRQVDAILDKANEVGMENLTKEEQEILKKASKKMNRDEFKEL